MEAYDPDMNTHEDHPLLECMESDLRLIISRDDVLEGGIVAHLTAAITHGVLELHPISADYVHDEDQAIKSNQALFSRQLVCATVAVFSRRNNLV